VHGITDGDAPLIYLRGLRIEIKKADRGPLEIESRSSHDPPGNQT
jgi:hypothetical protein